MLDRGQHASCRRCVVLSFFITLELRILDYLPMVIIRALQFLRDSAKPHRRIDNATTKTAPERPQNAAAAHGKGTVPGAATTSATTNRPRDHTPRHRSGRTRLRPWTDA